MACEGERSTTRMNPIFHSGIKVNYGYRLYVGWPTLYREFYRLQPTARYRVLMGGLHALEFVFEVWDDIYEVPAFSCDAPCEVWVRPKGVPSYHSTRRLGC